MLVLRPGRPGDVLPPSILALTTPV